MGKIPHEKTDQCNHCKHDADARCVEIDPLEMHSPEVRVALTS